MIPELIFWIAVFLVLHTYVLYPLILRIFSAGRKGNSLVYERNEELPVVSVIISAHNEDACIKEKVQSIFAGSYPSGKFEVLIGSDHSTDKTEDIIRLLMKDYSSLKFFDFKERRGKGTWSTIWYKMLMEQSWCLPMPM
jgi:cellulose synthase/poly-beta-1,6-N-acetylglucosamine synthase-like glycosyltransferase